MRYLVIGLLLFCIVGAREASATTAFANRTLLSCDACHSVGTRLNAFGIAFRKANFTATKLTPRGEAPASVRGQFAYSSDPDPTGLPKAILDEVDFLSAGPIGKNLNYGSEVYYLDGGRIGSAREGWLEYHSRNAGPLPLRVEAGLIVLPTAVDPEKFRETNTHYTVYDQTVGANPFQFFDPHNAVSFSIGRETRGPSMSLLAVDGYDKQSGLSRRGLDRMVYAQESTPGAVFSAYRYDGLRALGGGDDRFHRQGVGANVYRGRLSVDAVIANGFDSNADGSGNSTGSSGGFLQGRYQIGTSAFGIVRYDGTSDTGGTFTRSTTIAIGKRFKSFRIEFEDSISHQPQVRNTLGIVFGFGLSTVRAGSSAY